MRYYIKHYTTKTVIDWMSLGHVGLLWSNNFFHVSLLNYSLIHLASLTNHLINLKSLNCEHVFFMFSSKLSTNQLFCGQYFSHLVFVHKNMFLPVKYSAQPHSHHDVPLSLVLCVFLLAQQHMFGCSVFFQSELHRPTSLLLPAITLKCRLEQALVTTC